MRFYTNGEEYFGTQADAKAKGDFEPIDVPTDKSGLLDFLNSNKVSPPEPEVDQKDTKQKTHPLSCSDKPNVYDVRDAVLNCPPEQLSTVLHTLVTRLYDIDEEKVRDDR